MSSITGGSSNIAAAFRAHVGLFSNLVPSAASCTAIDTADNRPLRKMSLAKSGNAIDTIGMINDSLPLRERSRNLPAPPPFIISTDVDVDEKGAGDVIGSSQCDIYVHTEYEPKVSFQLPINRRPSIIQQQQPTMRERIKGSPRFPHRIVPFNSLNALVETTDESAGECYGAIVVVFVFYQSLTHFFVARNINYPTGTVAKMKWKSMEDSTVFAASIAPNNKSNA